MLYGLCINIFTISGDKSLPEGWKIRSHQWWCQKRNSHRIHYEFLSPQNEFFKSRKAVVEHMTADGNYTQDQIEMVRLQTAPATDKNGKKKPAGTTPQRQDNSPCNPLIGWKTGNATLPPAWKIKRHEYANQTVYFYMSPKGDIIKSRRAVMDYMFEDGGYSEKDFNIVISGAKQRKVALQELFDNRLNKNTNKKKKVKGSVSEDPDINELDIADSDDNMTEGEVAAEETKKVVQKKPKVEIQPTRRSGRVASKIKEKRKLGSEEDEEEEEEAGDGKRKAEEEMGNTRKRMKMNKSPEVVDDNTKIEPTPDIAKVEEGVKSEQEEGGEHKEDLLAKSIQYLDVADNVSLSDILVDESEMQNMQRLEQVEDKPRLVNVTNSSVEHSAYNVVVNVLTDLVSTISE